MSFKDTPIPKFYTPMMQLRFEIPGIADPGLSPIEDVAGALDIGNPYRVIPIRPIPIVADIDAKMLRAQRIIKTLLAQGQPVSVSFSAGKDSSTVLNLVLAMASEMSECGQAVPPIIVMHADTGIENPEVAAYAAAEMSSIKAFAKKFSLDVSIHVATPNLAEQWAVRVIGGRALPPFPGLNRDCTTAWKIIPMRRLRNEVIKSIKAKASGEVVTLLGTRYDESAARSSNMTERGDSDNEIRRGVDASGKPGGLFLSPIAHWSTDDVWEYLGYARAGIIRAYSDFDETFRVYADAMGSSCVIIAEDMARAAKTSKACGARFGCSLCTAVGRDASMEHMLEKDDRYGYMKGLNDLQRFLVNTRWDLSRRNWLGRTIKNNHIRIAPDAYSPAMMEELLRYALSIDVREERAARRLGIAPRFRLVSEEQLFAIDAMWSLQAYHRPFHALAIYKEVVIDGSLHSIPEVEAFPKPASMPAARYFPVADWDEGFNPMYLGLRSHMLDMVRTEGDGCMGNVALPDGSEVLDVNSAGMFSIDMETAYFLLDEEYLDRLLTDYHDKPKHVTETAAYTYYAQLGMLSVLKGRQAEVDMILRRSNFKIRNGLAGQISPARMEALMMESKTAALAGVTANANGKTRSRGQPGSRGVTVRSLVEASNTDYLQLEAA